MVWAGIPGAVAQSYNQVRADAKLASSVSPLMHPSPLPVVSTFFSTPDLHQDDASQTDDGNRHDQDEQHRAARDLSGAESLRPLAASRRIARLGRW